MAAVAIVYHNKQNQNAYASVKGSPTTFKQRREEELANKLMQEMRGQDPSKQETPLMRLQRIIRSKVLNKTRLHRKNLGERLRFDATVVRGTARLINQVVVFALFVWALRLSSDEQLKRGIFQDLEDSFDFDFLKSISTREEFVSEGLPLLAEQSKQYFILSSSYFDAGGGDSVLILREMETFTSPRPTIPLTLQAPSFSFVAWVRTSTQFVDGYILRKRVASAGTGAELTCWGWYLHSSDGAQFHYGGHDYYNTGDAAAGTQQVEIGLTEAAAVAVEQDMMLTMTVEAGRVTFYQNDQGALGSRELPRAPTDCFNGGENILVGDSGLQLGMVRVYPRALERQGIAELFTAGAQLGDIATASTPPYINASRLDSLERTLGGRLDAVEELVEQRGPQSEVGAVLKAVEDLKLSQVEAEALVEAPLGQIHVNGTVLVDRLLPGRSYTQLIEGPWILSKTERDEDHRTLHGLPSFVGTGATLSFWYKHFPCEAANCGVYLFVARNDAALCWSFWLENTAWYFDNVKGTPKFQYPRNFVPDKFNLNGDEVWRHIAMVFDEVTDNVRWYMDGELAVEVPWGSAVEEADCDAVNLDGSDRFVTLGRSEPGYTYGDVAQVYDLRMYVHPNGSPLTGAEIATLAAAEVAGIAAEERCLPITSPLMADTDWRDSWGHGCEWYYANAQAKPTLCEYPPAKAQCPIGCGSRQECLSRTQRTSTFVWDRVRRIERRSPNGTLCLNSRWTAEQVKEECRAWVAGGRSDASLGPRGMRGWLESMELARTGTRVDLRDCDELAAAVDESCSFEAAAVEEFTEGVKASNGAFTVAFWVRPVGPISKVQGRDQFIPHLQLLSTLSPPSHNLMFGSFANPNGEARLYSSCAPGKRDENENVELKEAEEDGWTLIAISRQNYTAPKASGEIGEMFVSTNMLQNWEGSFLPQCLFDDASFFNALEINYPMLISPIMLVPQAIPFAEIQQTYFSFAEAMKIKGGPLVSNAKRLEQQEIVVNKKDFAPRSALMAPPIIFQQRSQPAESCPFAYSDALLQQQHAQMVNSKCAPPFLCEEAVLEDARQTIACPGAPKHEGTHFGVEPMTLQGKRGYPELLYSITDNPFLWRDGQLTETAAFVDVLTETVEVVFVFFTPKFGITSVMSVTADFAGSVAAHVDVAIAHYEILEGETLSLYLFAQVVVLVSIGLMIMDIFYGLRETYLDSRSTGQWPDASSMLKALTDTAIAGMVIAFIAFRIPSKGSSASETERILGALGDIPWDSAEKQLADKLELFFSSVVDLMSLIDSEAFLNDFCNVILVVSLFRVIQCTSVHPRLALLTGTLIKAADDLWHATLLIVLLMCCFASIATWRFGSERPDFATFELSMQTQFMMTFGEFPADWNQTSDLQLYTVLYFMLVFLLVQNFLLAIIVEAFIKVREDNNELQTEMEFTSDVATSGLAHVYMLYEGWPSLSELGVTLDQWKAKYSVGFKELWSTGLFRTHRSVSTFLRFYGALDFLQPLEIKKRAPSKRGDEVSDQLLQDFAQIMGVSVPTLKEEAEENMSKATLRRELKMSMKKEGKAPLAPASASGLASPSAIGNGNGNAEGVHEEGGNDVVEALGSGTVSSKLEPPPSMANEVQLASVQGEVTEQLEALRTRLHRMEAKVEDDSRNIKEILRLLRGGGVGTRDLDLDNGVRLDSFKESLPGEVP